MTKRREGVRRTGKGLGCEGEVERKGQARRAFFVASSCEGRETGGKRGERREERRWRESVRVRLSAGLR